METAKAEKSTHPCRDVNVDNPILVDCACTATMACIKVGSISKRPPSTPTIFDISNEKYIKPTRRRLGYVLIKNTSTSIFIKARG